jgi:hypothetical protein
VLSAAVHESPCGTQRTYQASTIMSAERGRPEIIRTFRAFSLMTVADLRALLDCGVAAFDDLGQAAVTPSPDATTKASLIEILTYCRARA